MIQRLSQADRRRRRLGMAMWVLAGKTVREASVEFKVTPWTVLHACYEHGVTATHDYRHRTYRILASLQDGMRPTIIARVEHVTPARVYEIRRNARSCGIKIPEPSEKPLDFLRS